MRSENLVRSIVDCGLQRLTEASLNCVPIPVHPLMTDSQSSIYVDEGYENWLPIASTATTEQLAAFETIIGYSLPPAYKAFLQYKHFYELVIGGAEFFTHPVDDWLARLHYEVLEMWPAENLAAGLIPFAGWGGAGDMLCFDTTRNQETIEYPIVLWNHEDNNYTEDFSSDFTTLLLQLELKP